MPIPITLSAGTGVPALSLWHALDAMFAGLPGAAESAALRVDLAKDLQSPVGAAIEVPIEPHVRAHEAERFFDIEFRAKENPAYYPRFRGQLRITDAGHGTALLELAGSYDVPLGELGRALDMTLLAGAAACSLDRFLQHLLRDAEKRVREEEERYAEGALHFYE